MRTCCRHDCIISSVPKMGFMYVHRSCPGRQDGKPAFFISEKRSRTSPRGECPDCYDAGRKSQLVEVVSCRKCGYLFGALQDLGPRRAQTPDGDEAVKPYFDSFSTELGWMSDSFWSYISIDGDLPYPSPLETDDEAEMGDLFAHPAQLQWCVACGKKKEEGAGDKCTCGDPQLRTIKVFHRQCAHQGRAQDHENLYRQEKSLLSACPNCGSRNGSGIEPCNGSRSRMMRWGRPWPSSRPFFRYPRKCHGSENEEAPVLHRPPATRCCISLPSGRRDISARHGAQDSAGSPQRTTET